MHVDLKWQFVLLSIGISTLLAVFIIKSTVVIKFKIISDPAWELWKFTIQ